MVLLVLREPIYFPVLSAVPLILSVFYRTIHNRILGFAVFIDLPP